MNHSDPENKMPPDIWPDRPDYNDSHQSTDVVNNYTEIYSGFAKGFKLVDRFSYARWLIEQQDLSKFLRNKISGKSSTSCLDFACGTGRLTHFLASYFGDIYGVDISESMLEVAKEKKSHVKFICQDIVSEPLAAEMPFDLIIAFRFFLRAQSALRKEVLKALRSHIAKGDVFIFNVHDSKRSLNWPLYLYSWITRKESPVGNPFDLKTRSHFEHNEVVEMLKEAGFRIDRVSKIGVVPNYLYGLPYLYKIFYFIDLSVYRLRLPNWLPIERIYYCTAI